MLSYHTYLQICSAQPQQDITSSTLGLLQTLQRNQHINDEVKERFVCQELTPFYPHVLTNWHSLSQAHIHRPTTVAHHTLQHLTELEAAQQALQAQQRLTQHNRPAPPSYQWVTSGLGRHQLVQPPPSYHETMQQKKEF